MFVTLLLDESSAISMSEEPCENTNKYDGYQNEKIESQKMIKIIDPEISSKNCI